MDTVVFDKTGTLTAGKPAVVEVRPLGAPTAAGPAAHDPTELLLLAAAVERGSTHPLARAIAAAADAAGSNGSSNGSSSASGNGNGSGAGQHVAEEGSFVQEPGSGVTASVAGRRVSVGTLEWVTRPAEEQAAGAAAAADAAPGVLHSLDEQDAMRAAAAGSGSSNNGGGGSSMAAPSQASVAAATAAAISRPGHILVYVGIDGQLAGTIEIADELRPDAAKTIAQLQVGVSASRDWQAGCAKALLHGPALSAATAEVGMAAAEPWPHRQCGMGCTCPLGSHSHPRAPRSIPHPPPPTHPPPPRPPPPPPNPTLTTTPPLLCFCRPAAHGHPACYAVG